MKKEDLPSDDQVRELFRQLRDTDWKALESATVEAVRRERTAGKAEADGYPRGGIGGGSPGTVLHCFTHGQDNCRCGNNTPIATPSDPTGNAASSTPRDKHHEHTENAIGYLTQAVNSTNALHGRLNLLAALRSEKDLAPEDGCWAMARVDRWEPIFRTTAIGDTTYRLGKWAYDFVRSYNRLPTLDECRTHGEGKRVFVKEGARRG